MPASALQSFSPSALGAPVLQAENLSKTFISGAQRLHVLRGVIVATRGYAVLNLLAGLDGSDSGSLAWEGAPAQPNRRSGFLGIVFQSFYLIPEIDALANVLMAARIHGRVGAAERARAKELMMKVGLAERMAHLPAQLSGGERQRVAVARALMNSPQLVLADEPTGNLDERTGDAVVELLLSLCRESGTALVLVTHNAAHAAKCARHLQLHEGRFLPATLA